MTPEWVEAIGTWFSGILVAGSLLFVWIQTRNSKQQTVIAEQQKLIAEQQKLVTQLANYHNLYLMWFNVDRIFIEHPELRPYFYEYEKANKLATTDEIKKKLDAVSHMILDCFDDVFHHLEHLPPSTTAPWDVFMKDMYKHTPYLKGFLKDNEQWYSQDFIRYLKS